MEAFDKLGMRVCHAWGMTETSPLGTIARPPAGVGRHGGGVRLPPHPGPLPGRRRGPPHRPRRRTPPLGRRVRRRAGGPRPVDRRRLLQRRRRRTAPPRRQVQRGRLAEDGRRRHHLPRRLPHPHRPRQGRHQVRRRVDLLGGAGERADVPPGRRRGRRRRRPRRQVGRAPAGHGRPQGGRHRRLRDPARLPRRRGQIAKWQLPERWTIIEAVPKTSVGKFDKKVLRRQYAEGELDVTQL